MLAAFNNAQEQDVLCQILEKIPEAKDWLPAIKFCYPEAKMEVILNGIPEILARQIMSAFIS